MRQDRYSKQVGRALAAVASADHQMRSRWARVWRLVRPTPRRLFMLGTASGGAFMAMVDEETRQNLQTETRALLDTSAANWGSESRLSASSHPSGDQARSSVGSRYPLA